MSSPTGVIPEDLMFPAKIGEVMTFIKHLAIPGTDKRSLLFGWARTVGVRVSPSQLHAVEVTGTDHWRNPGVLSIAAFLLLRGCPAPPVVVHVPPPPPVSVPAPVVTVPPPPAPIPTPDTTPAPTPTLPPAPDAKIRSFQSTPIFDADGKLTGVHIDNMFVTPPPDHSEFSVVFQNDPGFHHVTLVDNDGQPCAPMCGYLTLQTDGSYGYVPPN